MRITCVSHASTRTFFLRKNFFFNANALHEFSITMHHNVVLITKNAFVYEFVYIDGHLAMLHV